MAIWGSETTELIFLKFGKNDYVNHATPRAKNGGRPKGAWPGGIGEVVRSRVFLFIVPSTHLQLTMRSVA